ncbi:MAG TPA: CBS domain-containing protein [Stellaceae bacterium]|nr:CBS domain-containing protein [Stellaceae bacterium]
MNVRSILERKGRAVATVRPDASVEAAVALLRLKGIGALVVSRDGENVEGIISERDVVRAMAEFGAEIGAMHVAALMSREVVTCDEADDIAALMRLMTERRIRHLPVIARGALAGIVSIGDVVKSRIEEVESEATAMRELIAQA